MRTSVNLLVSDTVRLYEAFEKHRIRRSLLINRCLSKFFQLHPKMLRTSRDMRLVEYQPDGAGYVIVNIVFLVDVYNLAVSFRSFSRVSVSMMVTIALDLYLEAVVDEILGKTRGEHNYTAHKHVLRHNQDKTKRKWIIVWEIEKKKTKK